VGRHENRSSIRTACHSLLLALYTVPTMIGGQACLAAQLTPQQKAIQQKILNGVCCVPNLSSGYTPYQLKNGSYREKNDNGSESYVTLYQISFGVLGGKPVATAMLDDSGGGTGIFMALLLYEIRNDTPVEVGSWAVGDRADVRFISIRPDGVHITGRCFHGDREALKIVTLVVKRKDFDVAECITHPVSEAEKKDLTALETIWIRGYDKHELTHEDKQAALEIINRHEKDRKEFTEDFRLSLETDNYGSTPHPLVYDKVGKPIFHIDDPWKKIYLTVPLQE